jgi:hypothetical protein
MCLIIAAYLAATRTASSRCFRSRQFVSRQCMNRRQTKQQRRAYNVDSQSRLLRGTLDAILTQWTSHTSRAGIRDFKPVPLSRCPRVSSSGRSYSGPGLRDKDVTVEAPLATSSRRTRGICLRCDEHACACLQACALSRVHND